MNKITIALLVFLTLAKTSLAYYSDNFETQTIGIQPLNWICNNGVIVSNGVNAIKNGNASLYMPILTTLSNTMGGTDRKIWTDFYTAPRIYRSDIVPCPTIDTNATAQIFVNSNGLWSAFYKDNGKIATNTWDKTLLNTIYPTVTSSRVLYHVSVLHNYSKSNWSFFINGIPIATNLGFIADNVFTHQWFMVQNLGGNISNSCWIDDFVVTNKAMLANDSNSLTNLIADTTIPMALSLMYFNSITDPRPTNISVSATTEGANMLFGRTYDDGRFYTVYGTTSRTIDNLSSNGTLINGLFSSIAPISNPSIRYFYKISMSSEDNEYSITNNETYALYKQSREKNRIYFSGVPIDIPNRTIGGNLGKQLAYGLSMNDTLTVYNNGIANTFALQANGVWSGINTNTIVAMGQGVMIKRFNTGSETSTTILFGTLPTNQPPPITINNGINLLAWGQKTNDYLSSLTGMMPETTVPKDYLYLQNLTPDITLLRYAVDGWRTGIRINSGILTNLTFNEGAGILLFHDNNNASQWNP